MFLCLVYQGQQLTAGGRLLQPRAGEMVEGQNGLLHQQLHAGDGDETPGPGRLIQLRFPGGVDQVKHRRAGGKAAQEGQIRKGREALHAQGGGIDHHPALPGGLGQLVHGHVAAAAGAGPPGPRRRCR